MKQLMAVLLILSSCAQGGAQAPQERRQTREAALEAALVSTVEGKATGMVLVAKGGRVLATRAFSSPAQQPFVPRRVTSFDIASISKTFTAVLALKLAEQGRFDLNAPLRRYLPELPGEMEDITARHALAHDTGLPRYLEGDDLVRRTHAQALSEIAAMKRERKAGSGYLYSNVGPTLVALAIERSAREPFPELVRRLIFRPIGMRNSHFHGDAALMRAHQAPAFADGKRQGSPGEWPQTWTMLGSAGISMSVDDLLRFNRAVFAGSFLTPASRALLLAPGVTTNGRGPFKTADTLEIGYGLGLYHWRDRQGRHIHFHSGASDFGTNAGMLWRQEDDIFIAVLLNSDSEAFSREAFYSAVLAAVE